MRVFSIITGVVLRLIAVGGLFYWVGGDPKVNTAALKDAGASAVFHESPKTAHEWQSWRRSLYQFAPLLFKE